MRYSSSFMLLAAVVGLAGCAGEMKGRWPSLAARPGEVAQDAPPCPGCGQDVVAAQPEVPSPPALPLPADTEARLAQATQVIARIESEAPAQGRMATAAIAAANADPERSGDAEVARSRFEALFMPLSIEERRLDLLGDDIAAKAGADAVQTRIDALRSRAGALQQLRVSLPK